MNQTQTRIPAKQLVFSAAAIALASITSMIKFANLPMGGSVTLFSMLLIALPGYLYGPRTGIMACFNLYWSRSFLQFRRSLLITRSGLGHWAFPAFSVTRSTALSPGILQGCLGGTFLLSGPALFSSGHMPLIII